MSRQATRERRPGSRASRVCVVALPLILLIVHGCGGQGATSTLTEEAHTAATSDRADAWEQQSLLLGAAIQDSMSMTDASPQECFGDGARTDGRFVALVTGIDETGGSLLVNPVQYFVGAAAQAAAAEDGVKLSDDEWVYVRDREQEELAVPLAADAVFVVWYPPESVPNVGRPLMAAIGAMNRADFLILYAEDDSHRERLADVGAWIAVNDGSVVSLVENYTP